MANILKKWWFWAIVIIVILVIVFVPIIPCSGIEIGPTGAPTGGTINHYTSLLQFLTQGCPEF